MHPKSFLSNFWGAVQIQVRFFFIVINTGNRYR